MRCSPVHRRRSSRRPKFFSGPIFLAITQLSAEQLGEIAHEPARWQGEDPYPDNAFDHAPFDGAKMFRHAHTHNRGGNSVSGGKGDAQGRGKVDDHGGSRLGSEAVHGLEFNHCVTHGANDAPAAGGRTRCHDDGAGDDHPLIYDEFRSA